MSLRLSSSQSAHIVSRWGGLGIPGSEVPTTGDNGGSPLVNDSISPTAEYRIETVVAPSAGALAVFPDTSYEFSGAPDASYEWQYRLYEDSVDRGTAIEYLIVGSPIAAGNAMTALPAFYGSALVSSTSPEATISVMTALPIFSGSAHVSPVTSIVADTLTPVFVGSASVYETTEFAVSMTTGLPIFLGNAHASPVTSVNTLTGLPAFSGGVAVLTPASFEINVLTGLPTFDGVVLGGGVQSGVAVKVSGAAVDVIGAYVKVGGTYVPVTTFVKSAGSYRMPA